MKTIDVTPTWQGLLPAFLHVLEHGNEKGVQVVKEQLLKMAKAADGFNDAIKATGRNYQVRMPEFNYNNAQLSPDGYSKYNERWRLRHNRVEQELGHKEYPEDKMLPEGELIYGLDQAIEHAKEYFYTEDEYTDKRRSKPVQIHVETIQRVPLLELRWNPEHNDEDGDNVEVIIVGEAVI